MSVFEAIYNHDLRALKLFLERDGNPDLRDPGGNGLLHTAIRIGDLSAVDLLLRKGASVEQEDFFGNLPLHIACIFGERDSAELLVSYGAEIDGTTAQRTWTPLMLALNGNDAELAEWLLEQGADPNFEEEDQGWTPLLVACELGLKEICLKLIQQGCKVDSAIKSGDVKGRSALHLVSYNGELELAKMLVSKGLDINAQPIGGGLSPLHWAVYNGHYNLMDYYLQLGANTNNKAKGIYKEWTPLHYAVSCRRKKMLAKLLEHQADPLIKDMEGRTPLDIAWAFYRHDEETFFGEFIEMMQRYI